jgi:hypothetical protein
MDREAEAEEAGLAEEAAVLAWFASAANVDGALVLVKWTPKSVKASFKDDPAQVFTLPAYGAVLGVEPDSEYLDQLLDDSWEAMHEQKFTTIEALAWCVGWDQRESAKAALGWGDEEEEHVGEWGEEAPQGEWGEGDEGGGGGWDDEELVDAKELALQADYDAEQYAVSVCVCVCVECVYLFVSICSHDASF